MREHSCPVNAPAMQLPKTCRQCLDRFRPGVAFLRAVESVSTRLKKSIAPWKSLGGRSSSHSASCRPPSCCDSVGGAPTAGNRQTGNITRQNDRMNQTRTIPAVVPIRAQPMLKARQERQLEAFSVLMVSFSFSIAASMSAFCFTKTAICWLKRLSRIPAGSSISSP